MEHTENWYAPGYYTPEYPYRTAVTYRPWRGFLPSLDNVSSGMAYPGENPESSVTAQLKYSYFVRIINPKKKSDYIARMWHNVTQAFQSPTALKIKLMDSFPSDIPNSMNFQVGYFEPPNNTKRWIVEERDLETMYGFYESGAKINLWCEARGNQELCNENEPPAKKKKATTRITQREQKEDETDTIFKQLKEKHPDM